MKNLNQSLSKLKNAQLSKKTLVNLKRKKLVEKVLLLLWFEGFILGFKIINNQYKVFLKYNNEKPCINKLKSCKAFFTRKKIWKLTSNSSLIIFSTDKGLKTLIECKKQNLGGRLFLLVN